MKRRWKTKLPETRNRYIIVGFFGLLGLYLYPTMIYPMFYTEKFKKIQQENRKGIKQEDIQPGNMRVWRDPFDRNKDGK